MTSALRVCSEMRKPLSARSPVSAPTRMSLHPVLRLQKSAGNRVVARLHAGGYLQAKLTIGAPGDVYEEEADHVASQVMRQIGSGSGAPLSAGVAGVPIQRQEEEELLQMHGGDSIPVVQRQEEEELEELLQARGNDPIPTLQRQEEEEEEEELLQPRRASPIPTAFPEARAVRPLRSTSEPASTAAPEPSMPAVTGDVESRLAAGRGGGQVLDRGFRAELEGAFGYDFSSVRVHTGTPADELSGRLSAEAFTTDRDIYFRAGRYQPGTETGRFLLAHELTHVIQQGAAAPQVESNLGESANERESEKTRWRGIPIPPSRLFGNSQIRSFFILSQTVLDFKLRHEKGMV